MAEAGIYSFIIENKEIFKLIYAVIIIFICGVIVFKSDRLFRLSLHKGIRYFRNAFLFFGLGFLIRYVFSSSLIYEKISAYARISNFLFEYFLIMAGFFLLYSLLWKRIEVANESYLSSLFNARVAIFHLMALVLAFLDQLWNAYYFMFFSQILLFAAASFISYKNYSRNGSKHKFLKFYFAAMVLAFVAWTLNTLTAILLNWNQIALINVYVLNIVFFLLFLYGIIRVTKIKRY